MADKRQQRPYIVERIGRTVTSIAVEATSKREALAKAKNGEGEAISSDTEGRGWGSVYEDGWD